jgi:hypothetical protein
MLALKIESRGLCLAAALALGLHGAAAHAQESGDAAYRRIVDDAVREFSAEHWEEARALFKRAHELSPSARTLRGMGMTAFELRMYVQSLRELDAALKDTHKPLPPEMRAQVEQLVAKARSFVGRVQLLSEPPDATLLIDGKEPQFESDGMVLLDVGTHVVSATLDGHKSTNLRISVEGGGQQMVRVPMEPLLAIAAVPAIDPLARPVQPAPAPAAPAPAPPPISASAATGSDGDLDTFAWIALAAGGAFGAASGVFWAIGDGKYSTLENSCVDTCTDERIADSGIKTMDTLTTVFLVAAGAAAAPNGVLFVIHAASSGEEPEPSAVAVDLGPGTIAVRGRF